MSILVVEVLPQGIIFGADRNITITKKRIVNQGSTFIKYQGQSQRQKVLRWPNRKALVGYVGVAEIGGIPIDEWLYDFIGDNLNFSSFKDLSESLCSKVEAQRRIDEGINEPEMLIIHLGGFEEKNKILVPSIYFIRNTYKLAEDGTYEDIRKEFQNSEELWSDSYFGSKIPPEKIRTYLEKVASEYKPFWFHQGIDLLTFNTIESFQKIAFKFLCESSAVHPFPKTLLDWEKQVKMSILTYSAYFQAYKGPSEQFVGGGVDTVSLPWPD